MLRNAGDESSHSALSACRDGHVPESILDDYVRGALTEQTRRQVVDHMLVCACCLARLQQLGLLVQTLAEAQREPPTTYVATHATAAGTVRLVAERTSTGNWTGAVVGDGARNLGTADTSAEIISLLEAEFARQFPNHTCSSACEARPQGF